MLSAAGIAGIRPRSLDLRADASRFDAVADERPLHDDRDILGPVFGDRRDRPAQRLTVECPTTRRPSIVIVKRRCGPGGTSRPDSWAGDSMTVTFSARASSYSTPDFIGPGVSGTASPRAIATARIIAGVAVSL